jgi:UrcA family protein
MATSRRLLQLVPFAAAAASIAIIGGAAVGQTDVKEVVVQAPQVVRTPMGKTSSGGIDEVVSVDHHVKYTDLDLSKTHDMNVLQERIRAAAKSGCNQLRRLYPLANHDPACVKKAIAQATPQVRAAMAHP